MVGLSTAMVNVSDVADFFGCPNYFFFLQFQTSCPIIASYNLFRWI